MLSGGDTVKGVAGGKTSILGGDIICYCERKVHMDICLILNG